ncbi:MAG: type VI secretion system contractile sheath large subunit [Polyangiaceae bacterium]|nr:type VI secretion system contractile sheath large subunit [Polyangiaceae bacterium]
MAGETKGFMGGSMKFNTGDEIGGAGAEGPILPLRMLLVADLVPRDEHNAGASAPEAAIRIDPARFEELFTKLRPRIAVEVPSVLAEGKPVRVDLAPTSLKSFRPDGLCAELPLLRSLLDGRLILDRLRDGSITQDQARNELERLWGGSPFAREVLGLLPSASSGGGARSAGSAAPAPTPVQAPETNVDALLAMVDLPGPGTVSAQPSRARDEEPIPATPAVTSKFGDIIAQVAKSGKTSPGGIRPVEAIARVERALGAQIGAILQHPEVRRLEQAWRGLRLLTERAQGHSGIRIDIVSARPENAAEAFDRAAKTAGDPPICCAVVDVVIDGTATGFARLEAIAKAAEKHTIPAIVNGSAKLLGLDDLKGVDKLDHKAGLFEAPHKAPWRSAVSKPETRWVSIAMNGALARGPYDKTSSRVREAVIKEVPDDDGGFVWIPPCYLVGSLIVKSFRDTGWPHRIVSGKGGLIEDLQVREIKSSYEGEEGIAIPTEAFISTDSQRDLAKIGVLAIASAPNSDAAIVMNAPTAYVTPPKRTYDSASTEPELRLDRVSLIDQLFVARIVQFLHALCSKIPPSSDPAEVQPVMNAAMWTLFENAPPGGLEIDVKAGHDEHGTKVAVTVRPRRFLGVQIEEVSLEMPLG